VIENVKMTPFCAIDGSRVSPLVLADLFSAGKTKGKKRVKTAVFLSPEKIASNPCCVWLEGCFTPTTENVSYEKFKNLPFILFHWLSPPLLFHVKSIAIFSSLLLIIHIILSSECHYY
jgi:hypothetical protein